MRYERTLRILGLIFLLNYPRLASASDPSLPLPVATLDVSELLSERDLTAVAFSSDTSIAVRACSFPDRDTKCSLPVVRWENGSLKRISETAQVDLRSGRSSTDRSRMLFDSNERKVPRLQHPVESIQTITTLGMIGPEDVNREVVQVIDTATRKSCFEWSRSFPMTYSPTRSASISQSGEFVAIIVENKLSVYRLPTVCNGATTKRRR
jgi:hypothetical protein